MLGFFFLGEDLWITNAPDKQCTLRTKTADVSNQLECQSICVRDSNCVGIVYSYSYANNCFTCKNDNLEPAEGTLSFYRRTGDLHIYGFDFLIVYQFDKKILYIYIYI